MKPDSFPVVVAMRPDGKIYVRWCGDRKLFLKLAQAVAGDVLFQNNDAIMLEITLHDSPAEAQAEASKATAMLMCAAAGMRGTA